MLVGDVVGDFEFVERRHLRHPLLPGGRRVGMDVHSLRHLGIGFSRHHPSGVVEFVPAVVDGHHVHEKNVLGALVQTGNLDLEGRKHPPVTMTDTEMHVDKTIE